MRVWVVTWEYPTSEDGEVAGVVGVAATPEGARRLAEAEAREYLALRDDPEGDAHVVMLDGQRFPPRSDGDGVTREDWDLWIATDDYEVLTDENLPD